MPFRWVLLPNRVTTRLYLHPFNLQKGCNGNRKTRGTRGNLFVTMSWLTKGHAVLPARESVSNEATVLVCGPINRGATQQELQLNRVIHSAEPSQVLRLQVKLQLLKTVVYGYESAFNKPTVITMTFLTSAAIVNCLLLLTLVVILSLCPPLGVDAYPVLSRHRRTADDTPRNTHRTT